MKIDVHDLLEDAAPRSAGHLDVEQIAARGRSLQRRRALARTLSAVAIVVVVAVAIGRTTGEDASRVDIIGPAGPGSPSGVTTSTVLDLHEGPTPGSDPSPTSTAPEGVSPPVSEGEPRHSEATFTDPAGDTETTDAWAIPGQTRSPEPELDIVNGSVTRLTDAVRLQVQVANLTDAMPPGADGGAYTFSFTIEAGDQRIAGAAAMQRYNGYEEIQMALGVESYSACAKCSVTFDPSSDTITGLVPFTAIDEQLRAGGHPGLQAGDRLSGPIVDTQWVHTRNQDQTTDGPYAAAEADRATGPGKFIEL